MSKRAKLQQPPRFSLESCCPDVLFNICSFICPTTTTDFAAFLHQLRSASTVLRKVSSSLRAQFPLYRLLRLFIDTCFLPLVAPAHLLRVRASSSPDEFFKTWNELEDEFNRLYRINPAPKMSCFDATAFGVYERDLEYTGYRFIGIQSIVGTSHVVWTRMCCRRPHDPATAAFFRPPVHLVGVQHEKDVKERKRKEMPLNRKRVEAELQGLTGWPISYIKRAATFKKHRAIKDSVSSWFTPSVRACMALEIAVCIVDSEFAATLKQLDKWDAKQQNCARLLMHDALPLSVGMERPLGWISHALNKQSADALGLGESPVHPFRGESSCGLWRAGPVYALIEKHLREWQRVQDAYFAAVRRRQLWNIKAAQVAEQLAASVAGVPPSFVPRVAVAIMEHLRKHAEVEDVLKVARQWDGSGLLRAIRNASLFDDPLFRKCCWCARMVAPFCASGKCAQCCTTPESSCWRHGDLPCQ